MVSARRKVTSEEAEALVPQGRPSGRASSSGCATQGFDGRWLRYWADRLDRAPLRLVDVTPRSPTVPGTGLRLLVDDAIVEVDDGFLSETLARVLAVVRGF